MPTIRDNQSGQNYKVLATKVSPEAAAMLEAIAEREGTTVYTMFQLMARVLITLMCEPGPMSDNLAKMVRLFENIQQWDKRFNLADPATKQAVDSAIYILTGKGKIGTEAVMVNRPFFDEASQTYNVQTILEAFLCNVVPGFYRRLRIIGVDLECSSVYETLDKILDLQKLDPNEQHIHEMFSDNDRSDFGRKPVASPYKRHPHRDINNYNLFADEQGQDISQTDTE